MPSEFYIFRAYSCCIVYAYTCSNSNSRYSSHTGTWTSVQYYYLSFGIEFYGSCTFELSSAWTDTRHNSNTANSQQPPEKNLHVTYGPVQNNLSNTAAVTFCHNSSLRNFRKMQHFRRKMARVGPKLNRIDPIIDLK